MDLSIFFQGIDRERVSRKAKQACESCPVRSACLEEAIQTKDFKGVRAGLIGAERKLLWQARQRLIPKKERPDHGTRSGYFWELHHFGDACNECRIADNRYKAKLRGGYVYGPERR